jgi:hypothetical protein
MHAKRTWLAALVSAAMVLGGAAIAAAPAGAVTRPAAAPSCAANHDDEWPDWVNGVPAGFEAGANGGVYIWHDGDGWHVRVTHKTDDRLSVSGILHTSGVFFDVDGVATERGDRVEVSPDHHTITFQFNNFGHIDGLDFRTYCAPAIGMGFNADGHWMPANRVVIGHGDHHPDSNPFRIVRTR